MHLTGLSLNVTGLGLQIIISTYLKNSTSITLSNMLNERVLSNFASTYYLNVSGKSRVIWRRNNKRPSNLNDNKTNHHLRRNVE